ncbi:MAG: hypothetical protein M1354_03910 [Candidatus Marsarchaeota archaeon]|jgi:hypothetical protein|nr:hypothetical protein [Candidatus Marsarchaeota archaeon]
MKKQEIVYREIGCAYIDGKRKFTQLELSGLLGLSLSTINGAVSNLEAVNAVSVSRRHFEVISLSRLLLYWATKRKVSNDVLYRTRAEEPVREIERNMPDEVAFTCYTAYKLMFKDAPADYSEVYAYATAEGTKEIIRRFRQKAGPPNLVVLKPDERLDAEIANGKLKHSSVCTAQMFVDLWNLKEWYARDFVAALEKRLGI